MLAVAVVALCLLAALHQMVAELVVLHRQAKTEQQIVLAVAVAAVLTVVALDKMAVMAVQVF
jgi:hypothetical protein